MNLDCIYVAGFRHDVQFTRTCVASVRRWYPTIPIVLIKDRFYGDYSTRDLEKHFRCSVLATGESRFGWGFGKLEPLFAPRRHRFLVLDSDIVFAGPILARLEKFPEDFIVQREDPTPEFVRSHYFDLEKLAPLDSAFRFPGFSFNTGQWVGTSDLLTRADFAPWLTTTVPPQLRHPDVFRFGEQGLLNYMLMKHAAAGRLTLARDPFMEVGNNPPVRNLDIAQLTEQSPYRFLIHWCGLRQADFSKMVRGDILHHFEDEFFARVPLGRLRRWWFYTRLKAANYLRRLARRILRRGA